MFIEYSLYATQCVLGIGDLAVKKEIKAPALRMFMSQQKGSFCLFIIIYVPYSLVITLPFCGREGAIPPPMLSVREWLGLTSSWLQTWSCDSGQANQAGSRVGTRAILGQWKPALGLLLHPCCQKLSLSFRVAELKEWKPGATGGCQNGDRMETELHQRGGNT